AVKRDLGGARVKRRRLALFGERGPRQSIRLARQGGDRFPGEIDPRALRFASLNHNADHDLSGAENVHGTASKWASGSPTTRFCGFMRNFPSGVIASIK